MVRSRGLRLQEEIGGEFGENFSLFERSWGEFWRKTFPRTWSVEVCNTMSVRLKLTPILSEPLSERSSITVGGQMWQNHVASSPYQDSPPRSTLPWYRTVLRACPHRLSSWWCGRSKLTGRRTSLNHSLRSDQGVID